ncbi:MAG: hypothetical protein K8H86_15745 [Ignavibacteriaceae bacterium]|nr:hypothetical protein [Ignavibacteriaceae bacterium]
MINLIPKRMVVKKAFFLNRTTKNKKTKNSKFCRTNWQKSGELILLLDIVLIKNDTKTGVILSQEAILEKLGKKKVRHFLSVALSVGPDGLEPPTL